MTDDKLFLNRVTELAQRSVDRGIFTFTPFLGLREQDLFSGVCSRPEFKNRCLFGGAEGCERVMIRFGDPQYIGYEEDFPIELVKISPRYRRFSGALTHRDFLGSILSLGIERDQIGDIIVRDSEGYVFSTRHISSYIAENLSVIKRSEVGCELCASLPDGPLYITEQVSFTVSSERADGIVSHLYKLSRSEGERLFDEERVFVNGRAAKGKLTLRAGDVVSCRGLGRFRYAGALRETKKGRLSVSAEKYI